MTKWRQEQKLVCAHPEATADEEAEDDADDDDATETETAAPSVART